MAKLHLTVAGATLIALAGCAKKEEPVAAPEAPKATVEAPPAPPPVSAPPSVEIPADTEATAFGKGTFERADGSIVTFEFDANYTRSGKVNGRLGFSAFQGGEKMDITGTVTCGHYDFDKKRAWIGGEVNANRSTLAAFQEERYNTGAPIWFRFEESETHPNPPAKISDLRFGGDENIDDAVAFCKEKGWVAGGGGLHPISADGAVIIFKLPDMDAG